MQLNKVTFYYDDSTIKYITGAELAKWEKHNITVANSAYIHNIHPFKDDPVVFTEQAPELKLQRVYFMLVEEIAKHSNCGYTKSDLHLAVKPVLFSKISDNLANFVDNIVVHSTKNLTHDGWVALIEQLKVFATDIFHYQFKPEQ